MVHACDGCFLLHGSYMQRLSMSIIATVAMLQRMQRLQLLQRFTTVATLQRVQRSKSTIGTQRMEVVRQ